MASSNLEKYSNRPINEDTDAAIGAGAAATGSPGPGPGWFHFFRKSTQPTSGGEDVPRQDSFRRRSEIGPRPRPLTSSSDHAEGDHDQRGVHDGQTKQQQQQQQPISMPIIRSNSMIDMTTKPITQDEPTIPRRPSIPTSIDPMLDLCNGDGDDDDNNSVHSTMSELTLMTYSDEKAELIKMEFFRRLKQQQTQGKMTMPEKEALLKEVQLELELKFKKQHQMKKAREKEASGKECIERLTALGAFKKQQDKVADDGDDDDDEDDGLDKTGPMGGDPRTRHNNRRAKAKGLAELSRLVRAQSERTIQHLSKREAFGGDNRDAGLGSSLPNVHLKEVTEEAAPGTGVISSSSQRRRSSQSEARSRRSTQSQSMTYGNNNNHGKEKVAEPVATPGAERRRSSQSEARSRRSHQSQSMIVGKNHEKEMTEDATPGWTERRRSSQSRRSSGHAGSRRSSLDSSHKSQTSVGTAKHQNHSSFTKRLDNFVNNVNKCYSPSSSDQTGKIIEGKDSPLPEGAEAHHEDVPLQGMVLLQDQPQLYKEDQEEEEDDDDDGEEEAVPPAVLPVATASVVFPKSKNNSEEEEGATHTSSVTSSFKAHIDDIIELKLLVANQQATIDTLYSKLHNSELSNRQQKTNEASHIQKLEVENQVLATHLNECREREISLRNELHNSIKNKNQELDNRQALDNSIKSQQILQVRNFDLMKENSDLRRQVRELQEYQTSHNIIIDEGVRRSSKTTNTTSACTDDYSIANTL